jgi:hypothetical protein
MKNVCELGMTFPRFGALWYRNMSKEKVYALVMD